MAIYWEIAAYLAYDICFLSIIPDCQFSFFPSRFFFFFLSGNFFLIAPFPDQQEKKIIEILTKIYGKMVYFLTLCLQLCKKKITCLLNCSTVHNVICFIFIQQMFIVMYICSHPFKYIRHFVITELFNRSSDQTRV